MVLLWSLAITLVACHDNLEELKPREVLKPAAEEDHSMIKGSTSNRIAYTDEVDALESAFWTNNGTTALAILEGKSAEELETLNEAYFESKGRDIEYDMRGWSLAGPLLDLRGFTKSGRGLKGTDLMLGFEALHKPKFEAFAIWLNQLTTVTPNEYKEIYRFLSLIGGEGRQLLANIFQQQTGKNLSDVLRPVFMKAAEENGLNPIPASPDKAVAVIVSSGNWKQVLSGETDTHIGGYHWREVEAYVKEALERGYTPIIFTADGLPPSPDGASLLRGLFGPKVGFGLLPGTGPTSVQGQAIMDGFAVPRPLSSFNADDFATIHIAGGHGSHHDLVGNALVEMAANAMYNRGQVVTAVCHATPSLGSLLYGGIATGFSPEIDKIMEAAGYVLPEFIPTYNAHQGLKDIGVSFTLLDSFEALVNIHHWEVFYKDGEVPIYTGTGPEATDNIARLSFDWLSK